MSKADPTEFDHWFAARHAETDGFTALILLLRIGATGVDMLSCAYVHVIGTETGWDEIKPMLDQSRQVWDGVAFFAESAGAGGPLPEETAKLRMQERINRVTADRMVLNEAGFFDPRGRAIRIDPVEATG